MPRKVMVTNDTGQPIARAAVHVASANIDYTPDQLTGDNGTVFLRKQLYIDPPQWISARRDGYEPTEVPYPQKWPLQVKLHEAK